jgi:hypothetical protein
MAFSSCLRRVVSAAGSERDRTMLEPKPKEEPGDGLKPSEKPEGKPEGKPDEKPEWIEKK